ncbi:LD-carboxypeptidase [Eggerthia catenaformis]|uniref:S66 family peptidase n=1 Tax=Eggerthia catenaformis TaxID=31973 RepID=UPI0028ED1668|nr:LD-carboxypeptidase [Eggerthia catenaformis]
MIKTVGIVSLSSGIVGESFIRFESDIGIRRLKEYGLNVKFMPHALMGLDYIKAHPEKRAEDLLQAFRDPEIDMILCAIGGDDTYRLLPYLFDHNELAEAVTDKVFLGFSNTTINHLMLHKVGLNTFYGQAFLPDICELSQEIHPYTRKYFEELISTGTIKEIAPSNVWYEERKSFAPDQVGKPLISHPNYGFELLQGSPVFSGKILGGCTDSMYDFFNGERYEDMPILCEKYHLFPDAEDWKGHILLLESSEEKPSPEKYRQSLEYLKERGVFEAVSGVLVGKPMDEAYAQEYQQLLIQIINKPDLPVVFNLNIGHSMPRCIIPFGIEAVVDVEDQIIRFTD